MIDSKIQYWQSTRLLSDLGLRGDFERQCLSRTYLTEAAMASEVLRPATNFVMDGMRMLSGIVPDKHKLGRKESFMPHARKIDPFFIVVTDADEKSFNVLGPMSDDTQINHLVVLCQNQGRKVNCHTAGLGQSREQIITSYTRQSGFAYSAEPIAA